MKCTVKKSKSGASVICARGQIVKLMRCACGDAALTLCDFPVFNNSRRGTCDQPVCDSHAAKRGFGDACQKHRQTRMEF